MGKYSNDTEKAKEDEIPSVSTGRTEQLEDLEESGEEIQDTAKSGSQIATTNKCMVPPLVLPKLIGNNLGCGDSGFLRSSSRESQSVRSIEDCDRLCGGQRKCVWFTYSNDGSGGTCATKKKGCEKSQKQVKANWSFRPTGWVNPDCKVDPTVEFVDEYVEKVKVDVCKKRAALGYLDCKIPQAKKKQLKLKV